MPTAFERGFTAEAAETAEGRKKTGLEMGY